MNKSELDYANVDNEIRSYIRKTTQIQCVDFFCRLDALEEKFKSFKAELNDDKNKILWQEIIKLKTDRFEKLKEIVSRDFPEELKEIIKLKDELSCQTYPVKESKKN